MTRIMYMMADCQCGRYAMHVIIYSMATPEIFSERRAMNWPAPGYHALEFLHQVINSDSWFE
jgi:hypothetical protein